MIQVALIYQALLKIIEWKLNRPLEEIEDIIKRFSELEIPGRINK